jgi:hypothetical protein
MESALFGTRHPSSADESSYKTPASGTSGSKAYCAKPSSATSAYGHDHHPDNTDLTELHRGHTNDPLAQVGSQFDGVLQASYPERLLIDEYSRNGVKSYHAATNRCSVRSSTNSIAGSFDTRKGHRKPKALHKVSTFDRLRTDFRI